MRLDSLAKLIAASDFMSFREICIRCLSLRGYTEVSLTDGWKDGGTDVRTFQSSPNPTSIAVQITVEKDWRKKVRSDARKVKNKLKLDNMILLSSQRIPETDFESIADEVWSKAGVRVTRIDNQGIASTFFNSGKSAEILESLGIELKKDSAMPASVNTASIDAALSFVFFGNEPSKLRDRMMESAAISVISRSIAPMDRLSVERKVRTVLALPEGRGKAISSTIDRMLQRGDLVQDAGRLLLNAALKSASEAMRIVRERDWLSLKEEIGAFICRQVVNKKINLDLLDMIMERLGALLLAAGQANALSLQYAKRTQALESVKNRLRELHAALDSVGFPEGRQRDESLEIISRLASNSPIGRHLLTAELFLAMSKVRVPHLINAIGAKSEITVFLDASVAIPILASRLFEPGANRYSLAANHAYELLAHLRIPMLLPEDYLEEVASHLISAKQLYDQIIELDPDLAYSENAFVAHYSALRSSGNASSFDDYLARFGLRGAVDDARYYEVLDSLKLKLERHFGRYGIRKQPNLRVANSLKKGAEEDVARAIHGLSLTRPPVVLRHDARTLAVLSQLGGNADRANVLCTWDSLHFWVRQNTQSTWDVIDPAILGDILSLVVSEDEELPVASLEILAKSLSDRAAEEGAVVWDALARIERGNMYDADLVKMAEEFKRDYLTRSQALAPEAIKNAWGDWKERYKHLTRMAH